MATAVQYVIRSFKPSGAETVIFRDNYANAIALDVLAHCVARTSTAMALTERDMPLLVFHETGFQRPAPSPCSEMIENVNIFVCFERN